MKTELNLTSIELLRALDFVDPSTLDYQDWLKVGTALKTEGLNFEVWDDWSKSDERYNHSEMPNKWDSLKEGTVHAGTIFHFAKANGYTQASHFVENNSNCEIDEEMERKVKIAEYNKKLEKWNEEDRKQLEQNEKGYFEKNLETSEPVKNYLTSRNITLETARKFCLGAKTFQNEEMLVIPNDNGSYTSRYLDNSHTYKYFKEGNGIFNAKELTREDDISPIFVTEGQLDALSILQEGYRAIALCSTANLNLFCKELKEAGTLAPLVACFDNDQSGFKATEEIEKKLNDRSVYMLDIPTKYNDINEWYTKDKGTLKTALNEAYEAYKAPTKEEILERYLTTETPLGQLDSLFCKEKNINPIQTGFNTLDKFLEGGLYGELYTLGAGSGEGKTAFSLQIMDSIAKKGQDVIIISLEMSTKETIARSLSRLTYDISTSISSVNNTAYAKTEVGISNLNRYKTYSKEEIEVIERAKIVYKTYASHIHIIEGVGNIGVEEVRNIIDRHIKLTGNIPVVLIDYLQLLAPIDMRSTDKQNTDKNILELKRMTRDYKVPILLISSLNRDSYSKKISMSSFKESGAIEYTSTVVMALEMETDDKQDNSRDIKLTILKNRKGRKGVIDFKYHYLFGKYEENEYSIGETTKKKGVPIA